VLSGSNNKYIGWFSFLKRILPRWYVIRNVMR
jgi:hypothetical protein